MNRHEANSSFYESIQSEHEQQNAARVEKMLVTEAAQYGVPVEEYKLAWLMSISVEAENKRLETIKKANEAAHHREQQRRASIRSATVPELMRSIVSKAPIEMFADVRAYWATGALSPRLIEWMAQRGNTNANSDNSRQ